MIHSPRKVSPGLCLLTPHVSPGLTCGVRKHSPIPTLHGLYSAVYMAKDSVLVVNVHDEIFTKSVTLFCNFSRVSHTKMIADLQSHIIF